MDQAQPQSSVQIPEPRAVSAPPPDQEAAYKLLTENIPYLRRYARILNRNAVDADDLVAQTLLRAIEKIHSWAPGTNMRGWLYVVLRNEYFGNYRKVIRRANVFSKNFEYLAVGVEGNQELRLEVRAVSWAFDKLSRNHREILALVAVDGMSYDEVARVLALPIGTVRSRINRARSQLSAYLDEDATS